MNTPSQSKRKSVDIQKKQADTLNNFLKPIIERITEEKMKVYKVSLMDSLIDFLSDRKEISVKDIEEFFDNEK